MKLIRALFIRLFRRPDSTWTGNNCKVTQSPRSTKCERDLSRAEWDQLPYGQPAASEDELARLNGER
jgi:hypothetical protein